MKERLFEDSLPISLLTTTTSFCVIISYFGFKCFKITNHHSRHYKHDAALENTSERKWKCLTNPQMTRKMLEKRSSTKWWKFALGEALLSKFPTATIYNTRTKSVDIIVASIGQSTNLWCANKQTSSAAVESSQSLLLCEIKFKNSADHNCSKWLKHETHNEGSSQAYWRNWSATLHATANSQMDVSKAGLQHDWEEQKWNTPGYMTPLQNKGMRKNKTKFGSLLTLLRTEFWMPCYSRRSR